MALWRGLVVAPETRCSPYDRNHYAYPASVEAEIIEGLGGIWSPYTGEQFESAGETDFEHLVALSEAHDSGACARPIERRRTFARDLDNLTLADPDTNRRKKGALDAADWMPPRSRCWFAARVLAVRREWILSMDRPEAEALEGRPYPLLCRLPRAPGSTAPLGSGGLLAGTAPSVAKDEASEMLERWRAFIEV